MSELAALKKQRATNKGKLTNIMKFATEANIDTSIEQLNVRLNRVEQLMKEFTELESLIFQLDATEQGDAVYEENYYNAVAALNTLIREKNLIAGNGILNLDTSYNATQFAARSEVKLPKIHIPSFSGDYSEWQSFFDLFSTTIHEAPSLNAVQKFQYLKGLLRGEAAILLRHINVTEGNYIGALNKLKERYDRKKHIINSFIRTFVEQPQIHTSNATHIKRLMDTSDEVIRGLKALGEVAESRDPWLIYILMNKLDDKSKAMWAETVANIDSPDFPQFLKFLAKRIDTLESLVVSGRRANSKTDIKGHLATEEPASTESLVVLNKHSFQCAMCKDTTHSLFQCNDFHALNAKARRDFAKRNNRCFNCLSSKHPIFKCLSRRRCQKCGMKHNSLLHLDDQPSESTTPIQQIPTNTNSLHAATSHPEKVHVSSILPTALIKIMDASGKLIPCRALLDSGSQASFITESCVQRLQIKKRNSRVSVSGLGHSEPLISRGLVTVTIKPELSPAFPVVALVLSKITSKLPQQNLDIRKLNTFKGIKLADPNFGNKSEIDILIGADHFFYILQDGQIRTNPNEPILQNTIFGWIVSGRRNLEGRFVVRLPFKESSNNLGHSLIPAIQRFRGLERRFARDPSFAKQYHDFLREYEQLNHMTEIPTDEITNTGYYIPHHGVFKSSSSTSSLRVVFDGSAKTSSGISLNDCLAVGPTIQSSLFAIILRIREHKMVFSADVQKMYRQVVVSREDTDFQKIVWREDPSKPIRHFRLNTVTYGLASSSFLATRAIKQAADNNSSSLPLAAKSIFNDMYVDDIMTGANNEKHLLQLQQNITILLADYGFQLRKWKSNSSQILAKAKQDVQLKPLHDHIQQSSNSDKVLGIIWNAKTDCFIFTSNLPDTTTYTKRTVLSEASRIFDPLGWLAPVVVNTKIFLQMLWADNLQWDDPLPVNKRNCWEKIRSQLIQINSISIPRFIQTHSENKVDIHGFCDASQMAYAAVVYFKVIEPNGNIFINMVSAKTKVAPIKQQTLPRLELCAAVLLTNLVNLIRRETHTNINHIYAWTDSKIVLDWLGSHPKRWNTFVGNRTAEVLSSFPRSHWRHVPSADNPADCATRGLSPLELKSHRLWWNAPEWLTKSQEYWPPQIIEPSKVDEKSREILTFTITTSPQNEWFDQLIAKYSSFIKLQRVVSYIFRYSTNSTKPKGSRVDGIYLHREEIFHALNILCQYDQHQYYREDISSLQANEAVGKGSNLKSLNPYLDNMGIIRVGGRLQNCEASYSTKHPIILHPKSKLTSLILLDAHLDNKHAGPSLLLAICRQQFWIPNGKSKAKEILKKCVICSKFKAVCQQQLMGNLPSSRVELVRPFIKTGVDYAGPMAIHLTKGREQKTYKAYICLFICLSTKAVHLELASDLSSDAFLGALKRFTARRGVCAELHSDNGTNFIGAEAKLREAFTKLIKNSYDISDFFSRHRITWHFIPPNSPHFGGIWEAAIKSTKFHLKRVIGKNILTLEEMHTLLAEVEAILNSRPLCSVNETDINPLTPSHFLLGHPTNKIPEIDVTNLKISHLTRWQIVQQMSQHFWKRWYIEYLTSLQQRSKWRFKKIPAKIGDIVIVKDSNLPVNQWLLGRIINTHPGSDGIVRVVTIKTKSSELKRPIHKLCHLPVAQDDSGETQN